MVCSGTGSKMPKARSAQTGPVRPSRGRGMASGELRSCGLLPAFSCRNQAPGLALNQSQKHPQGTLHMPESGATHNHSSDLRTGLHDSILTLLPPCTGPH